MSDLKFGTSAITALKFDVPLVDTSLEPITVTCKEYNFLTDWTLNPDQPQDGIERTEHTIKIKRFRPNTWIIKSNYNDIATEAGFLDKFYGKTWNFSNLSENKAILTKNPSDTGATADWAHIPSNRNVIGFVLMPIRNDNALSTPNGALSWAIGEGCLKDVSGAAQYGFPNNGDKILYQCSWWFINMDGATPSTLYNQSNGYNDQMALTIFSSSEEVDAEGCISVISYKNIVDPTTVEGFCAYAGTEKVYDKEKTFNNVVSAYGFCFEERGHFSEKIQGEFPEIKSSYSGINHIAFVIRNNNYNGIYDHIRLPEITDLGELIQNNFPVKFFSKIERSYPNQNCFWDSVVDAFRNNNITDPVYADHLFATSVGDIEDLYLNFDVYSEKDGVITNNYIDLYSIFDYSSVARNVHINIDHGYLKVLNRAFRQSGVENCIFNKPVTCTEFTGTFEGTKNMVYFPANLFPGKEWQGDDYSEQTCKIHYAADGSSLTYFGNYKDETALSEDDKFYTLKVHPYCCGAFPRSKIREVKYLLDFAFVTPVNGMIHDGQSNPLFGSSLIERMYIKNLNKGDWGFDGTNRGSTYISAGNLPNLDATSVNYLLNNVFDLRQNDQNTGDTYHFETNLNCFNKTKYWTFSQGWETLPVSMHCWADGATASTTLNSTTVRDGKMKVKIGLNNCTLTLSNGGVDRIIPATSDPDGEEITGITIGECKFTFNKLDSRYDMYGSITLADDFHFKYELTPGLTGANIYFPAGFETKIDQAALHTANDRGWNVYVGGNLMGSPCDFVFQLTGGSLAANSSSDSIEFTNAAGYSDAFTMEAPIQGAVNTGFEAVVGANQQNVSMTVTNASTPFTVSFTGAEGNKEMTVAYTFEGTKDANQTVSLDVTFKNLSSQATKTVTVQDGSSSTLDLSDWYVDNGTVNIEVSFNFTIS